LLQISSPAKSRRLDSVLLALAGLFGAALLIANTICRLPALRFAEQFDPNLQSIRSLEGAVAYVRDTRISASSRDTANATDAFVRKRFVHGYSQFAPCEDWIAVLAGYAWSDLRSPVRPDDILNHRRGACSQQAIVFEAIAARFGLDAGSVRMRGHFLPALKVGGTWTVYDPDREITPNSYPLSELLSGDPNIRRIYGAFGRRADFTGQAKAGTIQLTDINRNPAPRASLFHATTGFFSHFGWAVFLALFLVRNVARNLINDWRAVPQRPKRAAAT
jgi:hypothetical protein